MEVVLTVRFVSILAKIVLLKTPVLLVLIILIENQIVVVKMDIMIMDQIVKLVIINVASVLGLLVIVMSVLTLIEIQEILVIVKINFMMMVPMPLVNPVSILVKTVQIKTLAHLVLQLRIGKVIVVVALDTMIITQPVNNVHTSVELASTVILVVIIINNRIEFWYVKLVQI